MCERKTLRDEDLDAIFAQAAKLVIAKKTTKGCTRFEI